jgi:hypothetical protein
MFRFKTSYLFLALGIIAPMPTFAANFCIAVSGGFGNGGTSFIAPSFTVPASNGCKSWSGFTKTAATVVATAIGTGCLSNSGKVLEFSILNTDPANFGTGVTFQDQVRLCPKSVTDCPVSGEDQGHFSGSAAEETCTASLLHYPTYHD